MSVLVFTRTTGYRHESIPAGIDALRSVGLPVTATEDPAVFTGDLASVEAVVFLNTSGDVLDASQRAGLESYVRGGGGFVGVHCAATTEPSWPFFGSLLGARFVSHPAIQVATLRVHDRVHPATSMLPRVWRRTDEWYDFAAQPPRSARVLLSVSEGSYVGGTMGARHPLAWCHTPFGARVFYTALGHTVSAYAEPEVRSHLYGAVVWAMGRG